MSTLQDLREKHSFVAKNAREFVETNNATWGAEHQEKYDAYMNELDDIKNQADRLQKTYEKISADNVSAQVSDAAARLEHDNPKNAHAKIFNAWLKGGDKALNAEDWAVVRNTMSTTTGSEGGFTVPSEVANSVIDALKQTGAMREVSTILQTDSGAPLSYPASNGTSEVGEIIAENTTATASDPVFAQVALNVYKFSSKIIAVPYELLQDSAVNVEAFISKRISDRIARIQNQLFTTGTGTAQPNGVVTASTSGKVGTTGQTTTVIYDDLIDLLHSVDPAYRVGSCAFMMNDQSLKIIRKLKDSQNRPIFLPGYELNSSAPDTILGYRVVTNPDIATMAANAKSILFGDFSKYIIRDAMGMTLYRFDDSAYAKLGQVGFLAWSRAGGNLIDNGGAVKYYQNSAT